jgi:hypothetical protein
MSNTRAVEVNTQAVSPVSIFGGAGAAAASGAAAAGASGAAGACAAASCTYRAAPPANMIRQIRTGRIFLILLIIDSIITSFHPLVQDEVVSTFVGMISPGLFMNTCCNRRCSSKRHRTRGGR